MVVFPHLIHIGRPTTSKKDGLQCLHFSNIGIRRNEKTEEKVWKQVETDADAVNFVDTNLVSTVKNSDDKIRR